ncbi:hypothetical protein ABBQ32_002322 [Trebouxia sp. C0010 RCD-2024]
MAPSSNCTSWRLRPSGWLPQTTLLMQGASPVCTAEFGLCCCAPPLRHHPRWCYLHTCQSVNCILREASSGQSQATFFTLFEEAVACTLAESTDILKQPRSSWPKFPFDLLDKRNTYMFELCHPQVRIVVQHSEPKLTHLATRWTLPFEDSELKIPLKDAETFSYPELQATIAGIPAVLKVPVQDLAACQELLASGDWANPVRHEGIVVTDAQFNRVKVKSPAYVGIAYALAHGSLGARGLAVYINNVVLKGEADEVAATMPDLAPKLQILTKVYDAYIAELVTVASDLQQEVLYEEGKARKGKWARACQSKPKFMFHVLLKCCDAAGPCDDAWFKATLYNMYDGIQNPSKKVGDIVLQELLPRYATKAEAETLVAHMFLRTDGLAEKGQELSVAG